MTFLCIDIGGTNTLFGVGEDNSFGKVKDVKTAEFLEDIPRMVKSVLADAGVEEVDEIAVAAAGPVDREKGIFYPPNIDMEFVQIKDPLEDFAETDIVNDCVAAVKGEYLYGESAENLLYVTISSGIGAAFMSDGEIVEGLNGNFAEVGHMKVGEHLDCGCGGKGHWEAYCSGDNMPQMAEELYGIEVENAKQLFELEGAKAEKAIEEFKERNRMAIANLINLYNPEKIVFGGAVALNHFDVILESLQEGLDDEAINEIPEVTLCELGEIAVLHGLKTTCGN